MYLRLSTVRRGDRTYRYAQLVESFRREGGGPTNRVIANLGALDDVAIANLRAALEASRDGKALLLAEDAGASSRASVEANLRYLDLAVLLRLWRELGMVDILAKALPAGDRTAPSAAVVAALVLQRCVAPGSKLAAERWYPTTALPELLGVGPELFNNSRLHRVLTDLEAAEQDVQAAIAPTLRAAQGAFSALFIDATDTWFVGEGPPIAQKGRDKEGIYRRRIGIVLLCDQRGYPLRWHTLNGRFHDGTSLLEMAREIAALPWAQGVPVAIDRAVGHAGATEALDASGLHYITALPDPELESSGAPIPWPVLDALQSDDSGTAMDARLKEAGFSADDRGRWVKDLGVFDKARAAGSERVSIAAAAVDIVESMEARSPEGASRLAGISTRHLRRHQPLRALVPEVRARLRDEEACWLNLTDLRAISTAPPSEQMAQLEALLAVRHRHRQTARGRAIPTTYRARAVLSVSPERVLADRCSDEDNVAKVHKVVADVNRRLSHRSNRRTDGSALAEVEQASQRYGLGGVLRCQITGSGSDRRVVVERDEQAWARRRRGDGINVILSHPDVPGDGLQLVRSYFAKDAIERDFRTIKSVVELRPVHHRTDAKVRAHVTVCVLALLLLRALERALGGEATATAALEKMEPVRLNMLAQGNSAFYTVTRPHAATSAILDSLRMTDLISDLQVASKITPR